MAKPLEQPQGRGDFFKSLGTLFAGFVAEQIEEAVVGSGPELLRPPGALPEFEFLTACTRCDKCIKACPQDSLVRAGGEARLGVGTPHLVPRALPCFLCTELPCIPACPEDALRWPKRVVGGTELEGPRAVKIGTAVIRKSRCLTWAGTDGEGEHREAQPCRTCVDRCPYPEEAIRLVEDPEGGPAHPEVVAEVCTGCGLCEFGCPTPQPAIVVKREG